MTKLTQIDENYLPARTLNERIMTREYASSFDVVWMSVRVRRRVLTCHNALIYGPRG